MCIHIILLGDHIGLQGGYGRLRGTFGGLDVLLLLRRAGLSSNM